MDALHTFWSSEGAAEDDKTTVQNIAMAAAATTSPLAPMPPFFLSRAGLPPSSVMFCGFFSNEIRSDFLEVSGVSESRGPGEREEREEGLRWRPAERGETWGRFRAHARPGVHRAARRAVARRSARGVPGGVSYTGRGGPFGSVECPRSPRRS